MTSPLTALALTLMVSLVMVEGLGSWKRRPWYPDDVQQMLPQYYWSTSHRRAYYPCAQTGLGCNDDKKCCSKHETCLTELKYNRRSNSCQDLRPERTGYKTLGQTCSDSRECADLCCREFHAHRHGRLLSCGPQEEDNIIFHNCV